jgi:dTDP-4-amino-4,6-dideoxygalactose transaminase
MNNQLAVLGGKPAVPRALEFFKSLGDDEVAAATRVIRSGVLSAYIGAPGEGFLGGKEVRAFEEQAAKYFGVKYAIAVNSWTSGLIAAVGAIGIEPGDEIITTPWTMAATATAILHFNGIPVFSDIDPNTFNIDPKSAEHLITPRTRAVMAVDIFGQSADMDRLREICDRHKIKLLCDTAQAPGARYFNKYAGTLADVGGYSLNYHKHIHCGEGGVLVTDDDQLAERLRLIRNHAEAVIRSDDPVELCNMLGYNFRMGEIEAAIASVQLNKLAARAQSRQRIAEQLNEGIGHLCGLTTPAVARGCTHVYYVYGLKLDTDRLGVSREGIINALRAEGVPDLVAGYQNLHLLPLFRNKIAYGSKGFPWNSPYCSRDINYGGGLCPVAEDLHKRSFIGMNLCMYEYPPEDVALIVDAFRKVWNNLDELRNIDVAKTN